MAIRISNLQIIKERAWNEPVQVHHLFADLATLQLIENRTPKHPLS